MAVAQTPRTVFAFGGHAWRALSEEAKLVPLTGFLVGGALETGLSTGAAGKPPEPEALEALRRAERLRFVYAPTPRRSPGAAFRVSSRPAATE
jgi:hypothetical protein